MCQLTNIRGNIMGTTSFDMKIKGMRKPQDFLVYSIAANDESKEIKIQSDTRIGLISLKTGKGRMSKSHQGGAFFHHLQMDKLTEFQLNDSDIEALKNKIFKTASKKAGHAGLISDNSGARSIL